MPELMRHANAHAFLATVQTELMRDEAANNLMLGLALNLTHAAPPQPPYLATVQNGAALCAAAVMTPPANLVLYVAPDATQADALQAIVDDLSTRGASVPGVVGNGAAPDGFAELWLAQHAGRIVRATRERIYKLTSVTPPRWPPGDLREATADDVAIAAEWLAAFQHEALRETISASDALEWARGLIARERLMLWCVDGVPVSMAARSRPTTTGIAINMVYTPPTQRGRGYASAAVARLSELLLRSGYVFCMLYTDLGNATSNSIYQKIGYQPVCDAVEYRFAYSGAASTSAIA